MRLFKVKGFDVHERQQDEQRGRRPHASVSEPTSARNRMCVTGVLAPSHIEELPQRFHIERLHRETSGHLRRVQVLAEYRSTG